jgi:hypothetical protein
MDYKDEGADIEPMRVLLRENRAISSIAAELDQKSCFEIFTDPVLAERLLTVEERHVMRRHVLWTRILSERRTLSPRSEDVDLLEYARVERETLVLKPNRAYGGEGVVVGHNTTQGDWESSIDAALRDEERWVVQQATQIPTKSFHVMDDDIVHSEPFYYVMGFAPTRYGVGLVVRASQRNIVNVAQRGGMCGVMASAKAITPSAPASAESYST